MELNEDVISIQGIVSSTENSVGPLIRVKHRGGNEQKIAILVSEITKYMTGKGYIDGSKVINAEQVQKILLLLMLNLEYHDNCVKNIKEYEHLINLMPTLTTCLLANVVMEMDLMEHYCNNILILPLDVTAELLTEIPKCLTWVTPQKALKNIHTILKGVIEKLKNVDVEQIKVREYISNITDVTSELLLLVSHINTDTMQSWKQTRFHKHIGLTFVSLLRLLLLCEPEVKAVAKLVDDLLRSAATVIEAVTITVYCTWAEIQFEGQLLQVVVCNEAYHILEKYSKYKPAKELIQMLGTMARKPKTLQECINDASEETIISKIDSCCTDQQEWFTALLHTKIFTSQEAMSCVNKWYTLCTLKDVWHLVESCLNCNMPEMKKLVIKCASNLNENDLAVILARLFSVHGTGNHFQYENLEVALTTKLNKFYSSKENKMGAIKEIQLALMQNPTEALWILSRDCIKVSMYAFWLKEAFAVNKYVVCINDMQLAALKRCFDEIALNDGDYMCFVHFIEVVVEAECVDMKRLLDKLLIPMMETACEGDPERLQYLLQLLKELQIQRELSETVAIVLLKVLEKYRTNYHTYSSLNVHICTIGTQIMESLHLANGFIPNIELHPLNRYYAQSLSHDIIDYLFPNLSLDNYGELICHLLKILTRCVPHEWTRIAIELAKSVGAVKTLEILVDCLILVSQSTEVWEKNSVHFNALRSYVQNFGSCTMSIKNIETTNHLAFDTELVKQICRLLKFLPEAVRQTEGLSLITVFSAEALKVLASDKNFVCSLVAIDDANIKQVIAKKMLASKDGDSL